MRVGLAWEVRVLTSRRRRARSARRRRPYVWQHAAAPDVPVAWRKHNAVTTFTCAGCGGLPWRWVVVRLAFGSPGPYQPVRTSAEREEALEWQYTLRRAPPLAIFRSSYSTTVPLLMTRDVHLASHLTTHASTGSSRFADGFAPSALLEQLPFARLCRF